MKLVATGLERWLAGPPQLAGLRAGDHLGLLAHPASTSRHGVHILELLQQRSPFKLVRLFAPEHGLWGLEQDMELVRDSTDSLSGLPIISLYGSSAESLRVRKQDLQGLDAIVVDLQDVGSRYYTFIYTLSYVMEAAREVNLPVVVLDRPNPIGGKLIEGPVLHAACRSFVGRYPLPVRHAMTVGELARLFNDAFGIGCDLRIVEMQGWERAMSFEQTALPWIPPSPNMPTSATALVYPGGCLLEGTNMSEGRGTTLPFELAGAPWLNAGEFAALLRAEKLEGVNFRAATFRPEFQKHAGTSCHGVQVIVTDSATFRPFATYLTILRTALQAAPDSFSWRSDPYEFETELPAIDLLLGRQDLRPLIENGADAQALEQIWRDELNDFERLRNKYLLYH